MGLLQDNIHQSLLPSYQNPGTKLRAHQIHVLELDMSGEGKLLYAKGAVAGWTCNETGVSYVSYLLFWDWSAPPRLIESRAIDALNQYLSTL